MSNEVGPLKYCSMAD